MEITKDNYKILHENPLKNGDIVKFIYNNIEYIYIVKNCYLGISGETNSVIFTNLQLNKYKVSTEAYGYTCDYGSWPECKIHDYEALTRLVIFLFEEIEKRENPKAFTKSILSNSIKIKINIEPQIKIKLK
jgi:hypothetical protein